MLENNSHFYDLHGIVRISSDVSLDELSLFEVKSNRKLDLIVSTGLNTLENRSGRTPKYSEFGPVGASVRLELGYPLRVAVSSLLAKSRHVLYTNVVEPLLRYLFVSKRHVLLHSSCLSTSQGGLLISAPPDTGKTTTILKLILQSQHFLFLSDDMTILTPFRKAYCFPKPPTISLHTLEAIGYDYKKLYSLPLLVLRSRVHSKKGRSFMRGLGKTKIPILSLNALGQILVPPPKPPILSLIDSHRLAQTSKVNTLYFIARGKPIFKEVSPEEALKMVEANSDDAFNFPPYSHIMRHIKIDGLNYHQLEFMENQLLRKTLENLNSYLLRVEDYSWYKQIMHAFEIEEPTSSKTEEIKV